MAVTLQRFEVFRFPVMQSTFCFSNTAVITIPAASLINYFRPKGAVESVFIGEKNPYLGIQSKIVTQQLKLCIYKFYGCFNPKIIFRNTRRIKSFYS